MELAHCHDTGKHVWLLLRIRLMHESLVALSGRTWFVCINTRDQDDTVADLVLNGSETVDVIENRHLVVCRTRAYDQKKFIRSSGKDITDLSIALFFDLYHLVGKRIHFLDLSRNRKFFDEIH